MEKASETEWRKFSLGDGFCLADGKKLSAISHEIASFAVPGEGFTQNAAEDGGFEHNYNSL